MVLTDTDTLAGLGGSWISAGKEARPSVIFVLNRVQLGRPSNSSSVYLMLKTKPTSNIRCANAPKLSLSMSKSGLLLMCSREGGS